MLLNSLQDCVQFDFLSWKGCYSFASWESICWHLFERARFLVTFGSWSLPDLVQGRRKFGCHHTGSPSFTPFPVLFIRADLSFSLVSYTFAKKICFNFSCSADLLAVNFLGFCLYEKVCFSFIFERYLCVYRFLGWQFFFF